MSPKKSDPTKDAGFQRTLKNLLNSPPKPHSEMKLGKSRGKKKARKPKKAS